MKVIIAGSRDNVVYRDVERACSKFREIHGDDSIEEVVSGCAAGADTFGEQWAELNGIPVKRFPANWEQYGKYAGPIRNGDMAKYADALIAVWDGSSRGTANMISQAKAFGLETVTWGVKAKSA